jgi:hypothetical protein
MEKVFDIAYTFEAYQEARISCCLNIVWLSLFMAVSGINIQIATMRPLQNKIVKSGKPSSSKIEAATIVIFVN